MAKHRITYRDPVTGRVVSREWFQEHQAREADRIALADEAAKSKQRRKTKRQESEEARAWRKSQVLERMRQRTERKQRLGARLWNPSKHGQDELLSIVRTGELPPPLDIKRVTTEAQHGKGAREWVLAHWSIKGGLAGDEFIDLATRILERRFSDALTSFEKGTGYGKDSDWLSSRYQPPAVTRLESQDWKTRGSAQQILASVDVDDFDEVDMWTTFDLLVPAETIDKIKDKQKKAKTKKKGKKRVPSKGNKPGRKKTRLARIRKPHQKRSDVATRGKRKSTPKRLTHRTHGARAPGKPTPVRRGVKGKRSTDSNKNQSKRQRGRSGKAKSRGKIRKGKVKR